MGGLHPFVHRKGITGDADLVGDAFDQRHHHVGACGEDSGGLAQPPQRVDLAFRNALDAGYGHGGYQHQGQGNGQ